jgi:hypothetical protein
VTVGFLPPDWKVGGIARVKGSVSLQFFGGSQVVKLTNAIPADWIVDRSKMTSGRMDWSEKPLSSSALAGLGLTLSVNMGMVQAGVTVLSLQAKGGAALRDAQVFDSAGKAWPTFLQGMDFGGDGGSFQIVVAGNPQPPMSLALQVSGSAVSVEVPVLVENVSLTK